MDTRFSSSNRSSSARLADCAHELVSKGYFSVDLDTVGNDPSLSVTNLTPLTLSKADFNRMVSRAARQHKLSTEEADDPWTLVLTA
jgi:hypothetical protein